MTWKFYACVVIALACGAAVVWIKMDARRRIREEAAEKAAEEARKYAPPPPKRPPENFEIIDPWPTSKGSSSPITDEELERRINGKYRGSGGRGS